ncbi:hypothetical protein ACFQZX_09250 [Mucilaginibacter litoreus]|uniref:Holin-X, holin superfamily III n=1 Tax=Mucilaginibacter litoreus TaxID=1048221 RepID=A0ABW3AU63_9SPHI
MKEQPIIDNIELLEGTANKLITLIRCNQYDSRDLQIVQEKIDRVINESYAHQHKRRIKNINTIQKIVLLIIGIVMITLGMAMIIMPAPPYFEMFTIIHFNAEDGVTLMDLISLIIVFAGVYLILRALILKKDSRSLHS